jgi:hypothetical protein
MRATVCSFVFLVFAPLAQAQVASVPLRQVTSPAQGQERERAACRYMLTRGDDKYYRDNVRSFLELAKRGFSDSSADLAIQNMGDGASIAVLKIVDPSDLTKPEFVKAYLKMARISFSQPELTVCAEDKTPEVTLFLFNYLREKVNDRDLQDQIDSTKQYVLNQTKADASSPAEPPK